MDTFYHVTPAYNVPSIQALGLQTRRARGNLHRLFFVTRDALMWAFSHVVLIHDTERDVLDRHVLAVFEVNLEDFTLYQWGFLTGVRAVDENVPCDLLRLLPGSELFRLFTPDEIHDIRNYIKILGE